MARFQTKSRLEDLADVNLIGIGAYKFLILDVRDIKRARHKKILYADRCELSMPGPYFEDILQGYIKHHLPENMIVRHKKAEEGGTTPPRLWRLAEALHTEMLTPNWSPDCCARMQGSKQNGSKS